jgi:hypothetical protein
MAVEGRQVIQVPMIDGMLGVHDGCAHARAFKHVPGNLSSLLKIHSFLHANARRVLQCCMCAGHEAWEPPVMMCFNCVFIGCLRPQQGHVTMQSAGKRAKQASPPLPCIE